MIHSKMEAVQETKSVMFQCTLESSPPVTMCCPSGEYARQVMLLK